MSISVCPTPQWRWIIPTSTQVRWALGKPPYNIKGTLPEGRPPRFIDRWVILGRNFDSISFAYAPRLWFAILENQCSIRVTNAINLSGADCRRLRIIKQIKFWRRWRCCCWGWRIPLSILYICTYGSGWIRSSCILCVLFTEAPPSLLAWWMARNNVRDDIAQWRTGLFVFRVRPYNGSRFWWNTFCWPKLLFGLFYPQARIITVGGQYRIFC